MSTPRLKPPALHHVLDRPRLRKLVEPIGNNCVIFFNAGAGYGKTTLMAQLAYSLDDPIFWYQVDKFDRDPGYFLNEFLTGLNEIDNSLGVGSKIRLSTSHDIGQEYTNIIGVLCDEMSESLNYPLTICIDDCHLLDNEFIDRFIEYFITNPPPNVRLFLASRHRLKERIARICTAHHVREIDEDDLKFLEDETHRLLINARGLKVHSESMRAIHENVEGWAAGLVLVQNHIQNHKSIPEISSNKRIRMHVYDYLAEEVLSGQSDELNMVLMKGSVINPIDVAICEEAIGIHNVYHYLNLSEKKNLFINRISGDSQFRIHPLFRSFLIDRLTAHIGSNAIKALREKYGNAYESAGLWKQAVDYYIEAKQHDKARTLLEKHGQNMMISGEQVTLDRWLKSMGEINTSPELLLLAGRLRMMFSDFDSALILLKQAKDRFSNVEKQCECSIAIAECLGDLGRWREGAKELEPLLDKKVSNTRRLDVIYRLGSLYWTGYEDIGYEKCCKEATVLSEEIGTALAISQRQFMKAMKKMRTGDFPEAAYIFSSLVELRQLPESHRNLVTNNLASCLMLMGKYDEAIVLAQQCLDAATQQREEKWQRCSLDTLGYISAVMNREYEAIQYIKDALALSINHEVESYSLEGCMSYCHMGTIARWNGKHNTALEHHERCLYMARKISDKYMEAMGLSNIGADLMRLGRNDEAQHFLNEAVNIADKYQMRYAQTRIDFHNAWAALLINDKEAEILSLSKSLKRANMFAHNHFIINEGKISMDLFLTALLNGIETDYVSRVLRQIGAQAQDIAASLFESADVSHRTTALSLIDEIGNYKSMNILRKAVKDDCEHIQRKARVVFSKIRKQVENTESILTPRENQVLELVASGASNKKIGTDLFISELTVKTHVTRILRKLGLTSRLEAAMYYQQHLAET